MAKGDNVEVQDAIPDPLPRRFVMRLAHKFDIPPYYFWHPDEARAHNQIDHNAPPN